MNSYNVVVGIEVANLISNLLMLGFLVVMYIRLGTLKDVFDKATLYIRNQEAAQAEFKELAREIATKPPIVPPADKDL